jgi:hypothetical protein
MAWTISARPRTAALAVAAGLLLATGCNGSGDAATSPTTAATATASPTAEATDSPTTETPEPTDTSALPPLPDAATENTPEGAEAFIRYWFDVTNDLYVQPVADLVPQISHPECVACQRTEDTIAELAATDSQARTEPFVITSIERIGGGPPDVQRFNMVADAPANATVDSDGNESNVGEAARVAGIGAAYWEGGRWVLYGLELEPQ